jgi:putative peptidoglycan lipid II flippase
VAAGILLSRLSGLARQWLFSRYLGLSGDADAYNAAFRIPNILQNLFGEGVLSASFIPVYSRLRAEKRDEEATRLAEGVFAILTLTCMFLATLGVLCTPLLIDLIAPGFHDERRALTIHLVRIFFPCAGILVLSAWCLGILNSHRRFFLSYSVSVLFNLTQIGALLWVGPRSNSTHLVTVLAWVSIPAALLQFGAQLPAVFRFLWPLRARLSSGGGHVRTVVKNFVPVFFSRGAVQISAYVDTMIASLLPQSAVAALMCAQNLYTLPVSLFGMSISASELPAMSAELGSASEVAAALRQRLERGTRRIAFFVIPSAAAFILLGDIVVSTLFQSGRFGARESIYVWGVLAGSSVGLLASTTSRLYSSAFYALQNPRTPRNFALLRVALTAGLGWCCALPLPHLLGINPKWGVAGLTISAGVSGWIEYLLLRRSLQRRLGRLPARSLETIKLWVAALLAGFGAIGIRYLLPPLHPILRGMMVLVPYAALYLALTWLMKLNELEGLLARLRRR